MPLNDFDASLIAKFLQQQVAPIAEQIDSDVTLLKQVFQKWAQLGCLRLLIPKAQSGWGATRQDFIEYNLLLSQFSGALLFLQGQHQYALMDLLNYPITQSVSHTLANIVNNNKSLGICLSAKKKWTDIQVSADGFRISGILPWVSGYQVFDDLLVTFIVDQHIYYALLPLQSVNRHDGEICFSQPFDLVVAKSVNTVQLHVKNWLIKPENCLLKLALNQQAEPIPHPSIYNFAGATIALLAQVSQSSYFSHPEISNRYQQINRQLTDYLSEIKKPIDDTVGMRARGRRLAMQVCDFAKVAIGPQALMTDSSVMRLQREIDLYSAVGGSEQQVEAFLNE